MALLRSFFISAAVFLIAWSAGPVLAAGKIDSSLRLLRDLKNRPQGLSKSFDSEVRAAVSSDKAVVTIKFDHVLSASEIDGYENDGVEYFYIDGEVARTRAIYPARIPWSRIDVLEARTDVVRMESAWKPCMKHPLDVAIPEVEADAAWGYTDPLGAPLTGKGIRIADLDTGIDLFHPSFFRADGDTLEWIDVDVSGDYTPGVDAVDINSSGTADLGETLEFTDGWVSDYAGVFSPSSPSNDDGIYQTYWDWLYADTNNNGTREFGPDNGFTESDPTYGEPVYITLDDNDNGALDVGEQLVALGTSKVAASLNAGPVTRTRGVDLIYSDIDTQGHGTPVAGILAGGIPGRHRFCGVAPDADLIVAKFVGVPLSYLVPWARSQGADIMNHEWSQFLFAFLDGSSLDEELVSAEHQTITQVTPTGNLNGTGKHSRVFVNPGASVWVTISVPTYYTFGEYYLTSLWYPAQPADLDFGLLLPTSTEVALTDTVMTVDGYDIWNNSDTSPRGTQKFDLVVESGTNASVNGNWRLKITNNSADQVEVISSVADNVTSWSGGTVFLTYLYNNRNVCMPATADSALVNGSYSTRGFESSYGVGGGTISPGELSSFSGRGKSIDLRELVDICAPGNYDVFSPRTHQTAAAYPVGSYMQFSGTSAAAPFVAGAAALVLQAYPGIRPVQIEQMLTAGALTDGFTGTVWNGMWGYGKLRILNALNIASAVQDMADGRRPPALHLDQNYPNPFNPTTWIPFYIPADGAASLTIYNVHGEVVRVLRDRFYQSGPHSVHWDGRDDRGTAVSSGVYFCTLRQSGVAETRKMVLIR